MMDKMTDSRAAEVLAAHNEWRRYDGFSGEPGAPAAQHPTEIGLAIDHATARLRELAEAQAAYAGVDLEGGWIRATAPPSAPGGVEAKDAENEALRAEVDRLMAIAGWGGLAGDAPERIILASEMFDGLRTCDKWLDVRRVIDDGKPLPESATAYVRADRAERLAEALRSAEGLAACCMSVDGYSRRELRDMAEAALPHWRATLHPTAAQEGKE